jgi:hypothetical protein
MRPWKYSYERDGDGRKVRLRAGVPERGRRGMAAGHDAGAVAAGLDAGRLGPDHHLHLAFPPSYVLAGSTVAELRTAADSRSWRYAANGYQGEWLHLADVVAGRAELAISVQEAVADLLYALQLADGAEKLIRSAA